MVITRLAMTQSALCTVSAGVNTGLPSKGQRRGGTTVSRHSGLLSKGQRRGGRQCTDTQDLYLKVREEVGTQCRDTQDLYLNVRGEVRTLWSRHTEVTPPLWRPCLQ